MSMIAPVSGVGDNSKRTDLGMVQRIQSDAKIQNATGGTYGERQNLQQIAGGASTDVAQPNPPVMNPAQANPMLNGITAVPGNAPGPGDVPLSHGADGGPGAGSEVNRPPLDAQDPGAALARAMFLANPTSQLRRIVEAFNEEGK